MNNELPALKPIIEAALLAAGQPLTIAQLSELFDEGMRPSHTELAQVLEALSHGLTNKLLHAPTHALNQAEGDERGELAQLLARIYRLHPGE